ncbi:MAG: oxidoreductase [Flavipsychrobacter sp.]|nr:oxidoreductase [Flavipsychrobacter sp.]
MKQTILYTVLANLLFIYPAMTQTNLTADEKYRILTLEPGHFHAALVMKEANPLIDTTCYVYAPDNAATHQYLDYLKSFNTRRQKPTTWNPVWFKEKDYLEQAWKQPPGSILVLAGNNRSKTSWISKAVNSGYAVLADKPMAIDPEGFAKLEQALTTAKNKRQLVYDIMTERYEILNILQRLLMQQKDLFGELEKGSPDNPSIVKESLHHYYKLVAGVPLRRTEWQYDPRQAGTGLVDVTTHLVDQVQWTCFPEQLLNYNRDVQPIRARLWPTAISLPQYSASTGAASFPEFLAPYRKGDSIHVSSNGEMVYAIKGVHVRIKVEWLYKAEGGAGDRHYSSILGTGCRLVIRQEPTDRFGASLYVEPVNGKTLSEEKLIAAVKEIQRVYPAIRFKQEGESWKILVPDHYRSGHEAHFAKVTEQFLKYLKDGLMPEWEWSFMLSKYFITTQSLALAKL